MGKKVIALLLAISILAIGFSLVSSLISIGKTVSTLVSTDSNGNLVIGTLLPNSTTTSSGEGTSSEEESTSSEVVTTPNPSQVGDLGQQYLTLDNGGLVPELLTQENGYTYLCLVLTADQVLKSNTKYAVAWDIDYDADLDNYFNPLEEDGKFAISLDLDYEPGDADVFDPTLGFSEGIWVNDIGDLEKNSFYVITSDNAADTRICICIGRYVGGALTLTGYKSILDMCVSQFEFSEVLQ